MDDGLRPAATDTRSWMPAALTPFRYPAFRSMWFALLASNLGIWIQAVAAAWLMTMLVTSADMVALVQTATALPGLFFSLVGGVLADWWDRRRALLISQWIIFLGSVLLAALQSLDGMTPWLLLVLIFILGAGATLRLPAYQAAVSDLVPGAEVPRAVALNAVGYNIARSVGPALGGALVAVLGTFATFAVSAALNVVLLVALLIWKPVRTTGELPPEPLIQALAGGFHYLRQSPAILATMVRCAAYTGSASALWALLPLMAQQDIGGGPSVYGLLLACLGVGAVGGAFLLGSLRDRMADEVLVGVGIVTFALATLLPTVTTNLVYLVPVLVLAGAGWMTTLTSFNVMVQLSTARWVRARMLSLYYIAMHGGLALGSWAWGRAAEAYGLHPAMMAAGGAMLLSLALIVFFRLPNRLTEDLTPVPELPAPQLAPGVDPGRGPITVSVEYEINPSCAAQFRRAMADVRRVRLRDGALRWTLYQDAAQPGRWIEAFSVPSWMEDLRRQSRMTIEDRKAFVRAREFHTGAERPRVLRFIVRDGR